LQLNKTVSRKDSYGDYFKNRSIKLSSDGGALSSDTGELIFREFDEKISFSQTITKHLQLKDERSIAFMKMTSFLVRKFISLSQVIMRMMQRTV